ncbi:MAG TPA: PAS domain-containing protein [Candidatus Acidoferrum sp.]|nr:PAS domain-containing protein [Candidatus Acidoferrum sp.]
MKAFRDLGIQHKMQVLNLLIGGTLLLVGLAALFAFQVLSFRSNFQRDTATLAGVIANNSTAALRFKDDQAATEVVDSLRAKPTVIAASLALPDGSLLASFGKAESAAGQAQFPPPGESRFVGRQLLTTQPVMLNREQVGTLYLRSDYRRTLMELLRFYAKVLAGVVLSSTALGVFLSSRLGRTITGPVLQLANTARIIGEKKDYAMRAVVGCRGDEVGRLAESFNEMLGRIQSQDAALSLSQKKMEALINSIDGIVWERSADNLRFTFISRQCETILGYSPETWLAQPNFWSERLDPQDAAKALRNCQELTAKGHPYTCEYRMIAADGRTVWIRESGTVLAGDGHAAAVRGILLDITRQKKDAEELDKLNRKLMDTSRQAGMAEVATGVLHNVGNVLNSVSVAATVVGDRLRHSKLDNLRRATSLLREQDGHLAEFLTSDPKGKVLPAYLCTVTDQLAEEQKKLLTRTDTMGQHIEHMKEIVAMQQSYAKVSGAYERTAAPALVEDALRINLAAFDRHRIEVVREFDPNLPDVCVDRHKVLQILINVFRNAKYAMAGLEGAGKRLTIRVGKGSPGKVNIRVQDNGIGIPAENLTRIFNHGFTTKRDGHGFGLHSGANAAREMGGSLTARSDGPGKGAEFILELPTASARRQEEPAALQATS